MTVIDLEEEKKKADFCSVSQQRPWTIPLPFSLRRTFGSEALFCIVQSLQVFSRRADFWLMEEFTRDAVSACLTDHQNHESVGAAAVAAVILPRTG